MVESGEKEVPEAETSVGGISEAGTEPEKSAKLGVSTITPRVGRLLIILPLERRC